MEHLPNDQTLEHFRTVEKEEHKRRFVPRFEFDSLMRTYLMERQQAVTLASEIVQLQDEIAGLLENRRLRE